MDAREEYQKNIEVMKELRAKLDSVLSNTDEEPSYKQPDPLKHKYISFIKSGFRIAAGFALAALAARPPTKSSVRNGLGAQLRPRSSFSLYDRCRPLCARVSAT